MGYTLINTLLGISFFFSAVLGALLLVKSRDDSGRFLALTSFSLNLWIFANILFQISDLDTLSIRLMYIAGLFILASFTFFAYTFLGPKISKNYGLVMIILSGLVFFGITTGSTRWVVEGVNYINGKQVYQFIFGWLYPLYSIAIVSAGLASFYFLMKKMRKFKDPERRGQLIKISIATGIAVAIGLTVNIILPAIGYFQLQLLGPISVTFFVSMVSYTIFRHQIFQIKVFTTEILVFFILVIVFSQIFLVNDLFSVLFRFSYFLIILFFSVFLLKSIYREIKQREQIERLAERLSNVVSFTTHELRTPISMFKSGLDLLLSGDFGDLPHETLELVKKLKYIAKDMNQDVETFLNLNKLEIGKLKLNKEKLDLQNLSCACLNDYGAKAREKKIDLVFEQNVSLPKIMADKFLIGHAINNLINNAIKFTPSGGRVHLGIRRDANQDQIIFTIQDNGIGIAADVIPRLFQMYEQGSNKAKITDGSGIGLYLTKQIIKMHGGHIWAESRGEGQGAKFSFNLPV